MFQKKPEMKKMVHLGLANSKKIIRIRKRKNFSKSKSQTNNKDIAKYLKQGLVCYFKYVE